MVLVLVTNDVPGTAAPPAAEWWQTELKHPAHGSASSLVGGSDPGPLATQIRASKSTLLFLLLLLLLLLIDPPIASPYPLPMPMPSCLSLVNSEGESQVKKIQHGGGISKQMPPLSLLFSPLLRSRVLINSEVIG